MYDDVMKLVIKNRIQVIQIDILTEIFYGIYSPFRQTPGH